jgi:four helix bundle protein
VTALTSYRELEVWQAAVDLTVVCFEATGRFPSREMFGLSSQLRRAATSIPSNVAEGYSRRSRPADLYHVSIALG